MRDEKYYSAALPRTNVDLKKFRELIGYVGQEPVLMNMSARDNLLRGRMEHEAEVASVRQQQQLCVRYGFESAVGLLCFCVALLLPTPESVSRLSLSQACCPSARVPLRSHRGDEDRRRRQPAVARLVSAHRSWRRPSAWPGGM